MDRRWLGRRSAPSYATSPGACSSTVRAHGPCESSTLVTSVQSRAVPELPDLDVVADAFHAALVGRPLTAARPLMPLAVRGTPAELDALVGQRIAARRAGVGKFLDLDLDRDRVVVNPMLTGRFQLAGRGEKAPTGAALELGLGPRAAGAPGDAAAWTAGRVVAARRRRAGHGPLPRPHADGQGLPAARRRRAAGAGPRGGRDGARRDGPGAHAGRLAGPDPEAPGRAQEPAPQPGVRGGDRERVLATRSCGRRGSSRSASGRRSRAEEVDELYRATRSVLAASIELLRERVPPTFEKQVRDHLAVHNRGGEACPRCGTRITEVKAGGFPTGYCRGCQR